MSQLPSISFRNISFRFEDERVLGDLSFNAPRGQHTILKGESGSGKSTILKLLLGFYKPNSGSISINDNEDWDIQDLRRHTAWLPQDLNIGSGSVQEVIEKPFQFEVNGTNKPSQKQQVETIGQLNLTSDTLEKQFRDLSTGQRQRIGLAICNFLDKPLLLLDEPTSALDRISKQKIAALLLTQNRTVISTSHDPYWVERGDNIIELK